MSNTLASSAAITLAAFLNNVFSETLVLKLYALLANSMVSVTAACFVCASACVVTTTMS